ncbi:phosphopantetheine-binding protein [Micromonospora echinofusca]|uniref:phosphopantetheine-binding protein n=1 Tax=Micromonospora echinofusca TaxID=47858 RepID=UPI001AD766BD|nr:phosphopantetheine-binding protein [Micromonospora echinofusca]
MDRVGVHDDFFGLGGHSLLAMRIIVRARQERGLSVTFGDLMRHRTMVALADRLADVGPGDSDRALVWFRREGTDAPLFCVHPGGGSAHWYTHLAGHLDARLPVAAFEWPGLRSEQHHPASVEHVAEHYPAEPRQAQPAGPAPGGSDHRHAPAGRGAASPVQPVGWARTRPAGDRGPYRMGITAFYPA